MKHKKASEKLSLAFCVCPPPKKVIFRPLHCYTIAVHHLIPISSPSRLCVMPLSTPHGLSPFSFPLSPFSFPLSPFSRSAPFAPLRETFIHSAWPFSFLLSPFP